MNFRYRSGLSLVALLAGATCSLLLGRAWIASVGSELAEERRARTARWVGALDAAAAELDARTRRLAVAVGSAEQTGFAQAARLAGLEQAWLLDRAGRIRAAPHWPEAVGLAIPSLERRAPDGPALLFLPNPEEETQPHWVRGIFDDTVAGGVVGSAPFESAPLAGLADDEWIAVCDPGERRAAVVSRRLSGAELDTNGWRRLEAHCRSFRDDAESSGWETEELTGALPPALNPGGVAVVALHRPETRLAAARGAVLRYGGLATGGAAVLGFLIGWILDRRIRTPTDRLVRAIDAVAAGRADYGVSPEPDDPSNRVAAAFSRLQRSLELERRRSRAAERAAAWREVARTVAHEVKNPLAPIRLTVENLRTARRQAAGEFDTLFDEGSRTILDEVDQLRRLVDEFSAFARLPQPRFRAADLDSVVDEALELYRGLPGLELVRERGGPARPVWIDPEPIGRVVKNIVDNALRVMRESGVDPVLSVRTEAVGPHARIVFEDRGPGFDVPPERLFEPGFTTSESGSGLGLAIVARIVDDHAGSISAERRESGGARFVVELPLEET